MELKNIEELMEMNKQEVYDYQDVVSKNASLAWNVYKIKQEQEKKE